MQYRTLGRTGVRVSRICFGSWFMTPVQSWERDQYGSVKVDEDASVSLIRHAIDLGINFIDTANRYHGGSYRVPISHVGLSERIVGRAIEGMRDDVVLSTKVRGPMGSGPNDEGLSRKHIFRQIRDSLGRLKTDYIDLYYAHEPDPLTPMEETLGAFNDLVHQGKVHYLGCSNYDAWMIADSLHISKQRNFERFVVVQSPYNILNRAVEKELLPFAMADGVAVHVYSPLAEGVLSGKYGAGKLPDRSRGALVEDVRKSATDKMNIRIVEELKEMAHELGISVAQLALAWVLANPAVTSVIIGATSIAQLVENVASLDVKLSAGDVKRINEVSSKEST